MKTKYFDIPSITTIEDSVKPHFGRTVTIEVTENIFFRAFGIDMIIPKGFKSNGNSFPLFVRLFIDGYDSRFLFAALVHDYIYSTQFMPRFIADAIYFFMLRAQSNGFYAGLFYYGVRTGGWFAWNKCSKNLGKYPKAKHDLKFYLSKI